MMERHLDMAWWGSWWLFHALWGTVGSGLDKTSVCLGMFCRYTTFCHYKRTQVPTWTCFIHVQNIAWKLPSKSKHHVGLKLEWRWQDKYCIVGNILHLCVFVFLFSWANLIRVRIPGSNRCKQCGATWWPLNHVVQSGKNVCFGDIINIYKSIELWPLFHYVLDTPFQYV